MIQSFRHAGLGKFFTTGSKAGIQPAHAKKLLLLLGRLNEAEHPLDMNLPGWRLHQLAGDRRGQWAVNVDRTWRVVFEFEGKDAVLVDYEDYHVG